MSSEERQISAERPLFFQDLAWIAITFSTGVRERYALGTRLCSFRSVAHSQEPSCVPRL